MKVRTMAQRSLEASRLFRCSSADERRQALNVMADQLESQREKIILSNKADYERSLKEGVSRPLLDRLLLTPQRFQAMVQGVREIASQNEVLGILHERHVRPDGLIISKERIPLGVLGMIFESRPNIVVDSAALAIKSGNAILLKGGKEAKESNHILSAIIRESIAPFIPQDVIQLLDSSDRESVKELLILKEYVDVIIPRGGEELIRYVYDNSKIPIIAHFKGLCHIYVHRDAEVEASLEVCLNAKTSRPGVCNAMETLLVHQEIAPVFLRRLIPLLEARGSEIRGCPQTKGLFPHIKAASEDDWHTEYLDNILSIKVLEDEDEAITHIQKYGTRHTEGLCSLDQDLQKKFLQQVDASCLVINASTRFNDGGELGLGAELGISTTKMHAYGPMGAKEMTTTRYIVEGKGHVRL